MKASIGSGVAHVSQSASVMVEPPGHVSARLLKGITARRGRLPPLPPGDFSSAPGPDLGGTTYPFVTRKRGDRGSVTAPGTRGSLKGRRARAGSATSLRGYPGEPSTPKRVLRAAGA